jgi:hypothetical protein
MGTSFETNVGETTDAVQSEIAFDELEGIKGDKGLKGVGGWLLNAVKEIGEELFGEIGARFYEDLALSLSGSKLPKFDGTIRPMVHILAVKPKGQLGTTMVRRFIELFLNLDV